MKYWNELTAIEEQSIRLDCLKSLVSVVASGVDSCNREEIGNAIWHILGSLEDINDKLKLAFNECFDAVRDDDIDGVFHQIKEPGCGGNCEGCLCDTDEDELVNTEYKFDDLQSVVNSWIRNNPANNPTE